ncbi:DUF1566 domain-containing protein [Actimicrobium sp. CCC2.4]|uniref:Lcl domain-containing protein n=1 Tax=Actimicrobium sp. CCC2.4 TaxID=3048606 RepID=UPI002AC8EC8F|nr:DUF1566 domain-containing protein [Actimicrobium sp. CCC2.4]MEB0134309.1 DUF1566 domain-containing protein [Actimicrobium sp. CCC2.4]WPX32952.1 DUF1566 domain-containing protein [Actimicrobium sp. CCC2.4]
MKNTKLFTLAFIGLITLSNSLFAAEVNDANFKLFVEKNKTQLIRKSLEFQAVVFDDYKGGSYRIRKELLPKEFIGGEMHCGKLDINNDLTAFIQIAYGQKTVQKGKVVLVSSSEWEIVDDSEAYETGGKPTFIVHAEHCAVRSASSNPAMAKSPAEVSQKASTQFVSPAPGSLVSGRYLISADGEEVTDAKTDLVWRRCPEGLKSRMESCLNVEVIDFVGVGKKVNCPDGFTIFFSYGCQRPLLQPVTYSRIEALDRAKNLASVNGKGWRIPTSKEYFSLFISDSVRAPFLNWHVDQRVFPDNPRVNFITSEINSSQQPVFIGFDTIGAIRGGNYPMNEKGRLRLVRSN